jgi:hypothetical protein
MDEARFDRVVRWAGSVTTRRVLLGVVAGLAGAGPLAAAGAARRGPRCRRLCQEALPPGRERGRCIARAARGAGFCAGDCAGADACTSPPGGCGGSWRCFCATTTEDEGLCLDTVLLDSRERVCLPGCTASSECGVGSRCVRIGSRCGTCGQESVCVPLSAGCAGIDDPEAGGTVRVRWP